MNKTKIIVAVIIILLLSILAQYLYFKREIKVMKDDYVSLKEEENRAFKRKSDSLIKLVEKSEYTIGENNIVEEKLKNNTKDLKQSESEIKTKLSHYEKINYYNDIDSDISDSIITNSSYRYIQEDNNFRQR